MKIYRTEDNTVTKFIHGDGSETCIKTVYSVDYKPNELTGEVDFNVTDRNKYSVFISASTGCPIGCNFCYLTIDNVKFKKLQLNHILTNIQESILIEAKNVDLSSKYVKICWMGMGEAILSENLVSKLTIQLLDWILENDLALGLDGVDISTVLPKIKDHWIEDFNNLNLKLGKYNLNPNNKNVVNREFGDLVEYKDRSRFRFFYSLHSAIQETRDQIIPVTAPIDKIASKFKKLKDINVIIHHMFLDGINDTEEELVALVNFMKTHLPDSELRVLRYNKHDRSDIKESVLFEQCVCYLQQHLSKIKVQVSYGKDIKSACGQFIYNSTDIENLKVK